MPDVLSVEEEEALARELAALPFKPFDFHGHLANRQVVSFGYRYDYDRRAVVEAAPFPAFSCLLAAQGRGDVRPPGGRLPPGSHQRISARRRNRLAPRQGAVRRGRRRVAACALQLRFRRKAGERWERASLTVEPRSAYLLSGPARTVWEHSIPALDRLRYSITLRTLVAKASS